MKMVEKRSKATQTMVLSAILTALVVVLQLAGSFIHLGVFSVSLVLVPIVIGAAVCGPLVGAWLGFVFGVVVLMTDAAAFLAISIPGTVFVVLVKGAGCGLVAGLVHKLLARYNRYLAVVASAVCCPVVNTGVFLLGCRLFFFETVSAWGTGAGYTNTVAYLFLGLAGFNFIFELIFNVALAPALYRVVGIVIKQKGSDRR